MLSCQSYSKKLSATVNYLDDAVRFFKSTKYMDDAVSVVIHRIADAYNLINFQQT